MTKELLDELRILVLETSGTSFQLTVDKYGQWKIAFYNSKKLGLTRGNCLNSLLIDAIDKIKNVRVKTYRSYSVFK